MERFDIIIVGSGLSGAVLAERFAKKLDKRVCILDKRKHIGGNCFDYIDPETGLRISKYGPHFFHTNSERVWQYIQSFADWTPWEHKVLGRKGDKLFPIPINIDTINILFGTNLATKQEMEEWLSDRVVHCPNPANGKEAVISQAGEELYDLIYKNYTRKQWGTYPENIDASILQRVPVRPGFDDRYFTDKYQAQPKEGYTKLIDNMLDHENITVLLDTDYFQIKDQIINYEKLFFTGPIDLFYAELQMGRLEYRSLRFEPEYYKNIDYYQTNSIVNYPSLDCDFTRIVEYKHILDQKSADTVIFKEYGSKVGEPYYPVLNEKNKKLHEHYVAVSRTEKDIFFIGRLANFKYINMDEAILNSLELFEQIKDI